MFNKHEKHIKKNFIRFYGSCWWKQLMEAMSRKRFQEIYHNHWNCPDVVGRLLKVMCCLWEHKLLQSSTKHLQQKPKYGMVRTNKYGKLFCALLYETVLMSCLLLNQKCSKEHGYDFSQLPLSKQICSFIQAVYIYIYYEFKPGKFLSSCNKVIQMAFIAVMKLSWSQELKRHR